jgi:hypothetical protein
MTASKPPRPVTTPADVLKLFLRGVDTIDIAQHYGICEPDAYRLLRVAMEARRVGHDTGRNTFPTEHEPPMEGH